MGSGIARGCVKVADISSFELINFDQRLKVVGSMKKISVLLLMLAVCTIPSLVSAQNYAFTHNLFEKKSHDFGTVARAAQIDYVFEFKNNTKNTIEMSAVRTSCNCTTPTIEKKVVQPGETSGIRCKFNTRSFLGARRATVTVSFVKPYFAEVQLEVKGYVRRDIVVHPPAIDFKTLKEGAGGSQKVAIEYAGKTSWKVESVESSNPDVEVALKETHRGNSLVGYELVANIKPSAKPGYLNNFQILLKTNDNRLNEFPVSILGKVEESITISPQFVDVSEMKIGATSNKKLIIKGSDPFQIVSVKSGDDRVEAKISDAKKKLHIVPITVKTGQQAGPMKTTLEIATDLGGVTKTVEIIGNVIE